jgi:hypothetical protein
VFDSLSHVYQTISSGLTETRIGSRAVLPAGLLLHLFEGKFLWQLLRPRRNNMPVKVTLSS